MKKVSLLCLCGVLAFVFCVHDAYPAKIGTITIPVGTAGAAGTDGLSAYQIWLKNGHTGSEADFLASLVGATGAPGTNGTNGLDCQSTITSVVCGPNEPVKCAVQSKSGVRYAKTDCNNQYPTYDYVYDGSDGADGAAGQDGAPGCATTITKNKVGRTTTLTAKDCNNQTIWTETVEDGADAPDQCEGLSAADKATRIVKRTEEYKEPTSNARGYMKITTVNCNDVQTVTHQDDTCGEVRNQSVTSTVNCATGEAVMSCRKQTDQTAKYYVCEARADSNAGVVPLGAAMEADKDQLQTEINKKLNTTDAESTYLNKTDAGNTYLATANLGTALKDNSVKTDLAAAVTGSGALSSYASKTDVETAVADKADKTELNAYLKSNELGAALKDNSVKTDLAAAVTGSGALTSVNNKVSALESTVGDSSSGLVAQVATNTNAIGDSTSGLTKAVADATSTANTASTNASSALTTANTASGNATRALNKATTNETNISSLNTTVSGHTTSIGSLQTSVSTVTSSLTGLSNRLDGSCSSSGDSEEGRRGNTGSDGGSTASNTGDHGEVCGKSIEQRIADIEARLSAAGI